MALRLKKIAGIFLILIVIALASLAVVLSHDSPCEPALLPSGQDGLMKAVTYGCYGSADVLDYGEVDKPVPADNEILVKLRTAAVNPLDWHYMRGSPYIMRLGSGLGRPKDSRLGVDFAGTVEAVGSAVTRFRPGDEVFGGASGAFAEYLTVADDRAVAHKPGKVTFAEAAAVTIAGITALQALRDKGTLEPGQRVLINGASGGVGTFAVQIARAIGAEVTAVCSTRNVEMVRSLGADHVIDYTKEDYTESGETWDVIIDNVGNHSLLKNRKVLSPEGTFVIVGGPAGDWVGPLARPVGAALLSPFVGQDYVMLLARLKQEDLEILGELMAEGKLKPVIDRHYPLDEVAEAIRYSEAGHARGKIIIDLEK